MLFRDLLEGHCSPSKMSSHPLNHLLNFCIRYDRRPAFSSTRASIGEPFLSCAASSFNFTGGISLGIAFFDKTTKSGAAWCFMLFASCFAFNVAYGYSVDERYRS